MSFLNLQLSSYQIEKDKFFWREKESSLKADIGEISQRKNSYYESRFSELEQDLQKLAEERAVMERKLEEALREPGFINLPY